MVSREKIPHLDFGTDVLRVVACFFVIMIHGSGLESKAAVYYDSFARFSVPIFIMISGYYMLNKQTSVKTLLNKSVKLLAVMLMWSGLYLAYNTYTGTFKELTLQEVCRYLLTEPTHLWYIYAACGLYILTPVLCRFAESSSKSEYRYSLFITFFIGSVLMTLVKSQTFPLLSAILEKSKLPLSVGFIFLYLFGGYIKRYGMPVKAFRILLYALSVSGVFFTAYISYRLVSEGKSCDYVMSFFAPNVIFTAMGIFVFFRSVFPEKSHEDNMGITEKTAHWLSAHTFGIYLIHPLILAVLTNSFPYICEGMAPLFLVPAKVILTFMISALIIFPIKKMPVLKMFV